MLNLDIIAALMNAQSQSAIDGFNRGEFDPTPNETLVTGVLDTLPAKVYSRAYKLACKSPLYAGQS